MANKKKKATAAIASVTALALLLGGTFAWQSISQVALNEKEAVINPGGRLHDDFNGTNKDVYVENFANDPIFARVRLDEYFEITMNRGVEGAETTEVVTTGATKGDTSTYLTHKFDAENTTDDYWDWKTGGQTTYMPTFNKNKDSLVADINGTFAENYEDYVDYSLEENKTKTGIEIYDGDTNSLDEVRTDFDNLGNYSDYIKTVETEHTAAQTGTATLMSMKDWLAIEGDYSEETHGNCWVYDEDGWCYWSSPIKSGEATGLLLDGISLKKVMDDSYYYAIEVTGQFITADDLGKDDNTGFYADTSGDVVLYTAPSENALILLDKIGVDVGNAENGGNEDNDDDVETQEAEIQIALYNEDGTKVAGHGAGSTLAANSTYDIVATVSTQDGDYIVSDSRDDSQVSDKVEATVNVYATAYDSDNSTYNCVTSDGKLVTGNEDTFDYSKVEDETYRSLSLCATVTDITINEIDSYSDVKTEYALYPTGKEVFTWGDKIHNFDPSAVKKTTIDNPMKVLDGNGNDITTTGDLIFEVEKATSKDTKLEIMDGSVVFTIGDDETSDEIYLIAKNQNGKAREVLWIIYKGTLQVGDTTIYPNGHKSEYATIDISKTTGAKLTVYDFWGNEVSEVVYSIPDYIAKDYPETTIESGTLKLKEDVGYMFNITAKYDSCIWEVDYLFYPNLID